MSESNYGTIRQVEESDWPQVDALVESFFMRRDEANILQQLIEENDLIYGLVIERYKDINGFICFSKVRLENNSQIYDGLVLGPIVVDEIWQGKQLATKLIQRSHIDLKSAGEKFSLVLGEENFYGRFGYNHSAGEGFSSPYAGPYLLAARWSDDVPNEGNLLFPNAFGDSNRMEVIALA